MGNISLFLDFITIQLYIKQWAAFPITTLSDTFALYATFREIVRITYLGYRKTGL